MTSTTTAPAWTVRNHWVAHVATHALMRDRTLKLLEGTHGSAA